MVKVKMLREVCRNDLFPTAEMVTAMSREFGVPLTAEDFGGMLERTLVKNRMYFLLSREITFQ